MLLKEENYFVLEFAIGLILKAETKKDCYSFCFVLFCFNRAKKKAGK